MNTDDKTRGNQAHEAAYERAHKQAADDYDKANRYGHNLRAMGHANQPPPEPKPSIGKVLAKLLGLGLIAKWIGKGQA